MFVDETSTKAELIAAVQVEPELAERLPNLFRMKPEEILAAIRDWIEECEETGL